MSMKAMQRAGKGGWGLLREDTIALSILLGLKRYCIPSIRYPIRSDAARVCVLMCRRWHVLLSQKGPVGCALGHVTGCGQARKFRDGTSHVYIHPE